MHRYSERQDWRARSAKHLPNFSQSHSVVAEPIRSGELNAEEAAATTISEYETQIAALERKAGQLTMEIDLLKKMPRLRSESSSETAGTRAGLACTCCLPSWRSLCLLLFWRVWRFVGSGGMRTENAAMLIV